jgi:hypothetical protein
MLEPLLGGGAVAVSRFHLSFHFTVAIESLCSFTGRESIQP